LNAYRAGLRQLTGWHYVDLPEGTEDKVERRRDPIDNTETPLNDVTGKTFEEVSCEPKLTPNMLTNEFGAEPLALNVAPFTIAVITGMGEATGRLRELLGNPPTVMKIGWRFLSIFSNLIFDSRVDRGTPSFGAAPAGPYKRPPLSRRPFHLKPTAAQRLGRRAGDTRNDRPINQTPTKRFLINKVMNLMSGLLRWHAFCFDSRARNRYCNRRRKI
jgi:hypothetical protein